MSLDNYRDNPNWVPRKQPRSVNPVSIVLAIIIGGALIFGVIFGLSSYNHASTKAAYAAELHVKGLKGKALNTEFVRYLKNANPVAFSASSDASLINTGQEVCLALKNNVSISDITTTMLSSFYDPNATAQLMTASVKSYCPAEAPTLKKPSPTTKPTAPVSGKTTAPAVPDPSESSEAKDIQNLLNAGN